MPVLAVSQNKEGRVILLGLSMKDILQLTKGESIQGSLERVSGVKGLELVILGGPTDEAIKKRISEAIPTETLPRGATAEDLTKMLEEAAAKDGERP